MSKINFFNQFPTQLCDPLHLFFVHKLEELGYQVTIVDHIIPGDEEALYFITFVNGMIPKNYILYNFEYGDIDLKNETKIKWYNGAIEVWDYSTRNIERMKLTTKHMFVPYLPSDYPDIVAKMRTFVSEHKTHDYLFYGVMNDKRRLALDSLTASKGITAHEVGVHCRNAPVIGDAMFALLGKTKCVVNIHQYADAVIEIYRITECLLLGVHVLSEDGFMDDIYKSRLTNLTIF